MADNWTSEQKRAIERDGTNILVAAAAGSGKTAVLVQRIIRKITDKDNPIDVDRMVVVTFTKAAAAEMKQRIRQALEDCLESEPDNTDIQRQLTLINNAQITTIDSFCLNIIRNYFTDIDLDPGFRTADDGEIDLLCHDVMEELLEDYYSEADENFLDFVEGYGTGRDDGKIEDIILKLYKFSRSYPWQDEWFDSVLDIYNINSDKDFEDNTVIQYLKEYVLKRLSDYDKKYTIYENICSGPRGPMAYAPAIISDHSAIRMMLKADTFSELSRLVRLSSFDTLGRKKDADVSEELKAFVKAGRDEYKKFINDTLKKKIFVKDTQNLISDIEENYEAVSVMVKLAKDFSERISAEKKKRNIIDFNDMEHMALDVLVKRENGVSVYTEASDILSEYYSEILIDEYQDSNMLQEAILTAVSRGKYDAVHNNMYMVGDVKQSIYRFRMARPQLFMGKYNSYTDFKEIINGVADTKSIENDIKDTKAEYCERIELQANFRSRKNVLDCTNDVFKRVMNKDYTGVSYDDNSMLNAGLDYSENDKNINKDSFITFGEDNSTEIIIAGTDNEKEQALENGKAVSEYDNEYSDIKGQELTARELEAQAVAERINELMAGKDNRSYMVYDKRVSGGYRKIRYSDIVILLRTVTGWADTFVNELMNNGIPAYSDASSGYFNVREIKLLINFMAVIDNPLQDIPMAAVMLSYFGRFDTQELSAVRMTDNKRCIYTVMYDIYEYIIGQDKKDNDIKDNAAGISYGKSDESELNKSDMNDRLKDLPVEKICSFVEKVEMYRKKSELMSIYSLLWEIMYNTGYYDYVGTMPAGKARQANLDLLLSKAAAFESTSYNGLFNFLRYIERMKKFNIDMGEASILGENEDLVRIMSIHKSKGLEFPVVFVAGMNKKINMTDISDEVIVDQDFGIGTNVVNLNKRIKNPTCIKAAVSLKLMQESISEELRVLYVAMTRAREKLIMTGYIPDTSKKRMVAKWKEKAVELRKSGQYSYSDVSGITNYYDCVMPVAYMDYMENQEDNSNVFNAGAFEIYEKDVLNKPDMDVDMDKEQGEINTASKKISDDISIEELPPYPYSGETSDKVKVTVSELKQMHMDADYDSESMIADGLKEVLAGELSDEERKDIIPEFISGEKTVLTGNERGTAYHKVMACLNYDKTQTTESISNDIKDMLACGKLTKAQYDTINVNDIYAFTESELGTIAKEAYGTGRLKREQPFVFIDKESADNLLIQGVIDMYIKEADGITIVDYKTDRVRKNKAGEEELKKRYGIQLDYYAKAVSQITGINVKRKVIYSFTLKKIIDVTV